MQSVQRLTTPYLKYYSKAVKELECNIIGNNQIHTVCRCHAAPQSKEQSD